MDVRVSLWLLPAPFLIIPYKYYNSISHQAFPLPGIHAHSRIPDQPGIEIKDNIRRNGIPEVAKRAVKNADPNQAPKTNNKSGTTMVANAENCRNL
jgi:hypothetical protein